MQLDRVDHATLVGLWLNRRRGLYTLAQGVKLAIDATICDFNGASRGEEWYRWTCEDETDAAAIVRAERIEHERALEAKNG